MGDRDLVKPLLARSGTIHFGRVLMKPGKPLTFATLELAAAGGQAAGSGRQMLVFGLPGATPPESAAHQGRPRERRGLFVRGVRPVCRTRSWSAELLRAAPPSTYSLLSTNVRRLWCRAILWFLQRGTCFLFMAAICIALYAPVMVFSCLVLQVISSTGCGASLTSTNRVLKLDSALLILCACTLTRLSAWDALFLPKVSPQWRRCVPAPNAGNPVSSFVCFHLVVLPALRRLAGWAHPGLRRMTVCGVCGRAGECQCHAPWRVVRQG
jgi:hypothetical protein